MNLAKPIEMEPLSSHSSQEELPLKPKQAQITLLTSTGSGPVTQPTKQQQFKSAQPKQSVCDHIRKFSNSLIFNSIERVTKASSELVQRPADQ